MGNCALKPKVLMAAGAAPVPEELETSFLEDQKKVDAAKSLSNLFLQEGEKTTPEKIPVTEDLKTALAEAKSPTKEIQSPTKETKTLVTGTQSPVMEASATADDQKASNEETIRDKEVIHDAATVKEIETEVKPEEVKSEAAAAAPA